MLSITGLSAGYDGGAVIHDVAIEVRAGEIVALVGANGAGKTTLARTLSGVLPALGGAIQFRGRDITRWPAAARVRAGLIHVPEGRQVFAGLTVAQNLALGAYSAALPRAEITRRMNAVYHQFPILQARQASVAANLSGGQQQMLAIGRALMAQPHLLILDEPSLGLAPALVAEIFRLIQQLRAQGIAILLSEQNARMSLAIADRGYVIEKGRVALSGPAAELMASSDIAARYLGLGDADAAPPLDPQMRAELLGAIQAAQADALR